MVGFFYSPFDGTSVRLIVIKVVLILVTDRDVQKVKSTVTQGLN